MLTVGVYRLLLQQVKLNSRIIAVIGFLLSIAGAALAADWQSLPGDPCTKLSPFHHPEIAANYSNDNFVYNGSKHAHSQALQVLEGDVYVIAMNKCESASIPNHQCYWIPNSIVTKRRCNDCPPICRSKTRSLNFVQFLMGAAFLLLSAAIPRVALFSLLSDRVSLDTQVSYAYNIIMQINTNHA